MIKAIKSFWNEQDGAIGVEYLVITGIIAIGLIVLAQATLGFIGQEFGVLDTEIEGVVGSDPIAP